MLAFCYLSIWKSFLTFAPNITTTPFNGTFVKQMKTITR